MTRFFSALRGSAVGLASLAALSCGAVDPHSPAVTEPGNASEVAPAVGAAVPPPPPPPLQPAAPDALPIDSTPPAVEEADAATGSATLSPGSAPPESTPGSVDAVPETEDERSWQSLRKVARRCPKGPRCVSLRVHVVEDSAGSPVIDAAWLDLQLRESNRHFKGSDLGFRIVKVDAVSDSYTIVSSREQRDEIGRKGFTRGGIDVFAVSQLDDVDAAGEQIRGVHWRDRVSTDRRWIIIASYAMKGVLAHELGHFFGLPHSGYAASIMNKRDRAAPPPEKRSFVPQEREIIAVKSAAYFLDGTLDPVGAPL